MTDENTAPETVVLVGGGVFAAAVAQVLKAFGFGVVTMEHGDAVSVFTDSRPITVLVFDANHPDKYSNFNCGEGSSTSSSLELHSVLASRASARIMKLGRGKPDPADPNWFPANNLSLPDLLARLRR